MKFVTSTDHEGARIETAAVSPHQVALLGQALHIPPGQVLDFLRSLTLNAEQLAMLRSLLEADGVELTLEQLQALLGNASDTAGVVPAAMTLQAEDTPPPADGATPAATAGEDLLAALQRGEMPSVTDNTVVTSDEAGTLPTNPQNPGQSAGSELLAALTRGDFPAVAEASQTVANESGQLSVAPSASGGIAAGPSIPGAIGSNAVQTALTGSSGTSGTSTSQVTSQMSTVSNLGTGAQLANASLLVPFVQQTVGSAGGLVTEMSVPGATTYIVTSTTTVQPGQGAVAAPVQAVPPVQEPQQPVEPPVPPTPNGRVTIALTPGQPSTIVEGTGGAGFTEVLFTLTRTNGLAGDQVPYSISGIDQSDLFSGGLSGTVGFAAGQTVATLAVRVRADAISELPETLTVTLSDGQFSAAGNATASVGIQDDDQPTIAVSDALVSEDAGHAVFTVSLNHASATGLTFTPGLVGAAQAGVSPDLSYSTDNGVTWLPAAAGATMAAGATSILVRAAILDNDTFEGSKSFSLITGAVTATGTGGAAQLTNPTGASGTGTIRDDGSLLPGGVADDDRPSLGVSNAADVTEGQPALFTLSLGHALSKPTEVELSLGHVTTTAGDIGPALVVYTDPSNPEGSALMVVDGRFILPAGVTTVYVKADTVRDTLIEQPESFSLTAGFTDPVLKYADGTGASPSLRPGASVTATTTIIDPILPNVGVSGGGTVVEGDATIFTVALDRPLTVATDIELSLGHITTSAGDIDPALVVYTDPSNPEGSALTVVNGRFTLPAGVTSVYVKTSTVKDGLAEQPESFSLGVGFADPALKYADGTGASPALRPGASVATTVTITDPAPVVPPSVSISGGGSVVVEGDATIFTVSLDRPLTAATDMELSLGHITTSAGDIDPTLVVYTDPSNPEGSALTVVNGRFTLPAGVTSVYVKANTVKDDLAEQPESFSLAVGFTDPALKYADGTGADPALRPGASATDTVTITDPAPVTAPSVSVSGGGTVVEGDATIFTVSLDQPLTTATDMELSLGHITTSSGDIDPTLIVYTDPSNPEGSALAVVNGRFTLPAGVTSVYVKTSTVKDGLVEQPESFSLAVGFTDPALKYADGTGANPALRPGASGTDTVTITDPVGPQLNVSGGGSVVEGQSTIFTLALDQALTTATDIELSLGHITTSAGDIDPTLVVYTDPSNPEGSALTVVNGRFTLPAGVTSVYVKANTVKDALVEQPESFSLTASFADPALKYADGTGTNPALRPGASVATTVTITDPAPVAPPSVSVSGGDTVVEGDATIFTVSLDQPLTTATDMELSLGHITTSAGDIDPTLVVYTDPSNPEGSALTVVNGRFTLPAGVTSVYVKTSAVKDTLVEQPESFSLTVGFTDPALKYADGTGASPALRPGASATDTVTITDPALPSVDVSGGGTVVEGNATIFTVSLDQPLTAATDMELSLGHITTSAGDIDPTLVVYTDPSNPEGSALTVVNGRFTLPAGVTSVYVKATTVKDTLVEQPESFSLAVGFTDPALKYADGTGTNPALRPGASATDTVIITDIAPPDLSIAGGGSVVEGAPAVFKLSLGMAMNVATDIELSLAHVTTAAGDIDPTLVAYTDPSNPEGSALTVVNGRFTLPAGVTTVYVKAATVADQLLETPESFTLTAGFADPALKYADGRGANPALRPGASVTHAATITDPLNSRPDMGISGPSSVEEGADAVFTLTLGKAMAVAVEVDLALADITTSPGDVNPTLVIYTDPANPAGSVLTVVNGRFTLPAGVTTVYVKAATNVDTLSEAPENFSLTASFVDPFLKYADGTGTDPAPRTGASATGVVALMDAVPIYVNPTLSVTGPGAEVSEGSAAVFKVALNKEHRADAVIDLSVTHVTTQAGDLEPTLVVFTDPSDPAGSTLTVTDGRFTLPKGVKEFYVRAATVDDLPYEGPEQFSLTVAFGDPEMKYADGTGNSPQLRVGASVTQSATIIDDGSGTPYDPVGQPVTQNPVSDDDRRTIAITSPSINEGASHAVFTVSLSRATSESLTFTPTLSTTGTGVGHATPGTDIGLAADLEYSTDNGVTWVSASSGVTLAPGSTSVLVRVPVINDDPALYEGPESFNLVTGPITVTGTSTPAIIMNPEGVTGVGTIYDDGSVAGPGSTPADDDRPTISVDGTAVLEDAGYALFTVRLSSASGVDVVFTPTLGGTITPGSDTGTVTDLEYYDAGTTTWRSAAAGVTIAAGATSVIIRVPVVDDLDDEATETLLLGTGAVAGVSNPGGATGTGTITDNDPSFAFQTQSVTVTEGQAMDFVVQRVSGLGTAVTLNYSVLVSSTDSSTLPVTRTGTVSFTADQSQATISLASVNDSRVTDDQRFYLSLSTTDDQVWITQGTIQGTVRNDDAEISIQSITATGPGSDGLFTYTVTLARTNALGFSHAVDWTVTGAGENPAAIGDFTLPASQHVVFAANSDPSAVSDTQTFTFQAAPGLIVNGERAFNVQIAAAGDSVGGVVMGRDAARGTITPTGAAASIEAVTTSRIEGSDPTDPQTQTFRVTLSQAMSQDVVVEWRVQSFGSGTPADANAADFGGTFPTGTVTIAAGQTSALINFAPSPDSTVEPNEKFYVDFSVLSGPAGKVGPAVLGRILNDEASVGFAFPTVSGDEGDAGSNGHLTATVVRADYIRGDAHVDWHVEPLDGVNVADILGYFAAGQDVSGRNGGLPSGTVTITTGNVQADILMELVGNNIVDPSRYFRIVLDNPAAGTALGSVHVTNATILDDDAYFEMGAATLVHEEGQTGGTSIIEVVVNRVGDARLPASVNWSALGSGANPTNALDLQPGNGTGTVLFGAGESTARIQIHVRADDNVEPDEQLTVTLTGTTTPHHTLTSVTSNLSTQVTLTNDDASVSFDGGANLTQSMDEDGAGPGFGGAVFTFTVTRSGDTRQAVSVPWSIPLSGDLTAADFDAVSGTVNFAVGASTATITVRAVADLAVEGDESFSVVLAPVAGGGVSLGAHSTATGTLVNDDVAIQAVLVSAASEGAGGATSTYTYTLSRVGDTTRQASDVNWSVAGTSVVSGGVTYAEALSAGEFASATSGNLTWAAGDTSTRTVTVTVNNDTDVEGDEAFALNLTHNGSDRSNLLGDGLVGVVHDDDATVSITRLSPAAVPEGAAGTSQTVSFRVTRTGDLSSTLTVDLTAVGGTGPTLVTFSPEAETATISFGDGRPDQVVQILGGDQSVDVSYTVQGDDILEVGENITVTLSNPVATPAGGRVADTTVISPTAGSASVALTNDDDKITVTAAQSTVTEGDSGTTPVTFTLTRTGDTTKETIVNWRALPGTGVAVNADDFAGGQEDVQVANNGLPSGRVTFAAGQTSATVTVNVLGDVDVEGDENFLLNLVVVAGNTELTDTPVTILTDDVGYSLVARTDSVVEGNDPSTPRYIIFDLTRDPGGSAASVNWALSGGILLSDIAEIDIDGVSQGQNLSGSHTFTGSQISAVVRVKLVQDAVGEATKTATLTVTDPSGTPAFNPMTASVSLIDDDAGLSISAGVSSIGEGTDSDLTAVDTRPAGSNEDYRELTFTVARTGKLTQVSTVDWTVLAQAGVDADDFVGGVLPSGSLTFAEGETSKTITMRIVSDWKGEADEDVTVQLSNPSTGTGLITATAITTVTNDDAEVGFTANLTEATALSQMEGDSGYVTFSFTVTRTGVTTQAHEVSWRLKTETESGVTVGDFYDAYYDDPSSQHRVKVLPYGTVSFAAGETSKTIEIKVSSDTFAASPANRPWPPEVSSGLEQDEPFTVELFNPATKPANAGVSVAEDADIAHGIIVNDDVRIQIVSINTSLPEGRVPTSANGYDVNPFVQGQQDWVTHTVVVKRMGDLSQAVSFEWFVDEPNFASQMVTAVTNGVSSGSSGILSWAAGDGADKVLYFTAIPDDTPEADYGFDIKVRPNSSALAESARIDEFSVGDDTISTFNDTFDAVSGIILGSIVVKRDEAEVWISNDLYRAYDPETSRYDRFGEQTFKTSVTEVKLVNQELGPESNREGTVITAEAASDYTATSGSLSFDADHRTRTVTVNVNRDNLAEQRETFSLFLDNAANGSVGSDQTNVTIIDGDGTDTKFQLNVVGSTAIEGLDTYAQFRLDFGATTTQTNVFQLGFSGSAMLDAAGGKAGDYFRYVQYSTDGGATWISTAPALEFDYVAAPESTSRTQAVQYQFSNAGPEQFANWLDFTDLKEGQGYKVGGAVSGLLFNGTAAPPLDTSGRIYVVLESDGAWIDVDNDGVKDDDETTMAFDSSDLVSTFTNWGGDANSPTQAWRDLVNLAAHAVTIRVNDLPTLANNTNILDLRQFGEDDEIIVDLKALAGNGYATGTTDISVTTDNIFEGGVFTKRDQTVVATASRNGTDYTTTLFAHRWAYSDYAPTEHYLSLQFGTSPQVIFGDFGLGPGSTNPPAPSNVLVDASGFTGQVSFVSGSTGGPLSDVWIPVRADAQIDTSALGIHFGQTETAGTLKGGFVGVADLLSSNAQNTQALEYFRTYVGDPNAELSDIQTYFRSFDSMGIIDAGVKFLHFTVEWDGTGAPTWDVTGLDAAVVVAPQDGNWLQLQMQQDINVAANTGTTAADIQLNDRAAYGEGANSLLPIPPAVGTLTGSGTATWDGTIKVGPGVDSVLVRTAIANDTIDEMVEQINVTASVVSGDDFTVPYGSGTVVLVDDDSPQITVGAGVVYDQNTTRHYLTQTIDINNRSGDTPVLTVNQGFYLSGSQENNAGTDQAFTIVLRYQGQWEAAPISEVLSSSVEGAYNAVAYQHSSPPAFKALNGTREVVNGVDTGFYLYQMNVPAGTLQIMMRSQVETPASLTLEDLTEDEQARAETFTATVGHVDPVIVARATNTTEANGQAVIEVVAVGGDFANGAASVDYGTVDGAWVEHTFVVSRELATVGSFTLQWEVESPTQGDLPAGAGDGEYVNAYYPNPKVGPTEATDFIALGGQSVTSRGVTGTVTFAEGQKEAYITVRVRSDDLAEVDKDFRVKLLGEVIDGTLVTGAFESARLVSNPENPDIYKQSPLSNAGYGRIANDDRTFSVMGMLVKEGVSSVAVRSGNTWASGDGAGLGVPDTNGALAAQGLTAPPGYSLHQFVVTLEGSGPGAASVDWSIVVNGIDGNGGFIEDGTSSQAAGAHRAETVDFLLYDGGQGSYDSALGLTWGTPNGSEVWSAAKTLYFAEGVKQKVVTIAIRDDLLAEDAEEFQIVLSNPVALEGSYSPVGIDALRGTTKVLIADNDGTTVKVDIGWKDGVSGTLHMLTRTGDEITEGTGSTWDFADAAPTSPATDDDKRIVLVFTRSAADATASQAFFEINFGSAAGGGRSGYVVESGNIAEVKPELWRGIVDFAAGATEARVVLRVADDNLVEEDNNLTVTLYDAEYFPTTSEGIRLPWAGTLGWDTVGFGAATGLADWNTTRRDPDAYTATVRVMEDDVRLWFKEFIKSGVNITTYSFDDDRDTSTPDVDLSLWDPRVRVFEGDSAWSGASDQHASANNGDFSFAIDRTGNLNGNLSLSWEVVLDGTATADDFNAALFSGSYVDGNGHTHLVGATPVTVAERTMGATLTIAGLFAPDLTVENDETFHLVFKNPVSSAGDKVLFSPNPEHENDFDARDGRFQGRDVMTVGVTIANDDVVYSVAWNSQNSTGEVLEADPTASSPNVLKFDVTRVVDAGNDTTDGYIGASSVNWRVVPRNGSDITPADFFDTFTKDGQTVLPYGTVNFSPRDTNSTDDILKTVELRIRGDAVVEFGEHFTIELYNPSIGHIDQAAASVDGVIINDDTGLRVENVSVAEGDSGDQAVTVTVTRVGDLIRAGKPVADQITKFNWSVVDIDTNGDDRGTGSFSGTGVEMGDGQGETTTLAVVHGYAEETTTLTFNVKGDATIEADETLKVLLDNVTGIDQVLNNGSGIVTVLNDDTEFSVVATPTYETANNAVVEDAGGTYHFRITRSVSTPQDQTVTWSVVGSGGRNVVDAADFGGTLPSGQVTFTAGELYKDITFSAVSSDGVAEADEVFLVEVTAFGTGAENDLFVTTGTGAKGTIINDDASVFISDSYPITQVEGTNSDVRMYRFEVVRAGSTQPGTSTINWALDFTGMGADASDFTGPTSGTLTFTQDGAQLVEIAIAADSVAETTLQDFNILLSNGSGSTTILTPSVKGIIGDDDYVLSIANASVAEGDGNNSLVFTVTRTGSDSLPAPVSWALDFAGKTASADDFRATSGTFTIPAGVTTYTFTVPVQGDTQWEDDETFTINLDYGTGTASATGTLTNDDEGFSLAEIDDVKENDGAITFRINREGNLTGTSAVTWTITGSGANAASTSGNDNDFTSALTGTVNFADNQTYVDVTVNLATDTQWEPDETYTVTLSSPSAGSSIKSTADGSRTGTILNDDQGYGVSVDVSQITENQTGGNVAVFTITRALGTGASTVKWTLSKLSGDADAVALGDLLIDGQAAGAAAFDGTTLSFANGETSKTVTVSLVGDAVIENPASLRMTLSRDSGDTSSTLITSTADVQVVDDDEKLSLVPLSNPSEAEGNSGLTKISFKVTRTGSAIGDASATVTIAGTGDHPLTIDDIDHIEVGGQTLSPGSLSALLTFADGSMADQLIDIFIKGDTVGEFDERFTVTLSDPVGDTTLDVRTATQTIVNDDPVLELVMATTAVNEGNDNDDRAITFQVRRSGDLGQTATVTWSVQPGTTNPVDADDFGGSLPTGVVIFQAGESVKTVTFVTLGDDVYEPDESFKVVLSNPIGAAILGADSIAGTLSNDDVEVTLVANNTTIIEQHNGQSVTAQFTVTAQGSAASTLVTWHVEGTGLHPTNGADFVSGTLPSGQTTITMNAGIGTATIDIDIAGDDIYGPDEQFRLVIDTVTSFDSNQNPGGGTATVGSATVTVQDDDILIGLSQTETHRYVEDDSGTTEIRFYVDEIQRSANAVTMDHVRVDYHITGEVDGDDITGGSGTDVALSWDAVEERYYIGMSIKGDMQAEGNERFELHLDGARTDSYNGGVEIVPSGARVAAQILDDDFGIGLVSTNLSQAEDGARFVFDVLRTGQVDEALTVQWTLGAPTLTGNQQGVSANDFLDPVTGQPFSATTSTPLTGTLTFNAGQSTARFSLEASHDLVPETDERFAVKVEVTEVGGVPLTANDNQVALLEGVILNDETLPMPFDPAVDHVTHPTLDTVAV